MHARARAVLDFTLGLRPADLPEAAIVAARRHLLDLVGVAAAGSTTALGGIAAEHALEAFGHGGGGTGTGGARLMFDGRAASAVGATFANAARIDSIDAHDGHRLAKGHVGCGVLAAALAAAELRAAMPRPVGEAELLAALVVGFEIGTRAGMALHATAADYHTSGAWVALAAAATVARLLGLDAAATREAIGIAEYHGPRSPMMRVIDHPSMLKDGSGWGAMAGVSAALLARRGFTGAPAAALEGDEVAGLHDERTLALAASIEVHEVGEYVAAFPARRWSDVTLDLVDGRTLASGRTAAPGDPETPLDGAALGDKFGALAGPVLGTSRTALLREALEGAGDGDSLSALNALIYTPAEGLRGPDLPVGRAGAPGAACEPRPDVHR